MRKTKHLIKFGVLALITHFMLIPNSKAQIPVNDPAWQINIALSDSFSGTTLNTSKWHAIDSAGGYGLEMWFNRPNHNDIQVSGGDLTIHVDTLIPSVKDSTGKYGPYYHYQGGQIWSNDSSFKYGYLEINAKYPVGNQLYWPAFWLWQNGNCHTSSAWDNEIDIAENLDSASYYGHETATNIHWGLPDSCTPYPNSQGIIKGLPRLDSIFHKYALEWDVNNLTFYFDDKPVRVVPNSLVPTPQHALNVSFGCGINPIYDPSLPKHKMPAGGANYIIDYFNYYTLNTDCQNVLTISNPSTDYYNPSPPHKARAVEQSITTTTVGSQSPTFNLSDNCTLRATNYIILGAGTTINATGTGHFAAIVTPCP